MPVRRSCLALAVLALTAAACGGAGAVPCGDGFCPAGGACVEEGGAPTCLAGDCSGFPDGTRCSGAGRRLCVAGECRLSGCGDGFVDPVIDETCDEGTANSDDPGGHCRSTCRKAGCGDGIRDPGEACDEGMANSSVVPDACRLTCEKAFCGDGVIDLAEATGCFAAATALDSSPSAYAIAAGDADGDGLDDLLFAGQGVDVRFGRRGGGFDATVHVGGVSATDVVAADVDGDGRPDLVASDIDGVQLRRGMAGRTWAAAETIAGLAYRVAAARDPQGGAIYALDSTSGTLYAARLDAAGALGATQTIALAPTEPIGLAAGHFDLDQRADALVVGLRTAPQTPVHVLERWHTRADGQLEQAAVIALPCDPWNVHAGDVNGDGLDDAIVVCFDGTLVLAAGASDGSLTPVIAGAVGSGVAATTARNVDGDGDLDLLVASGHDLRLFRAAATTLAPAASAQASADVKSLALVDLDGDHVLDAVSYGVDSTVEAHRLGDGALGAPHKIVRSPPELLGYTIADLDGDGIGDVITTLGSPFLEARAQLDGPGLDAGPPVKLADGEFAEVAAGRIDADADADLVLRDGTGTTLTIVLGDGQGGARATKTVAAGGVTAMLVADVNGDGLGDVITTEAGVLRVRLAAADGTLAVAVPGPPIDQLQRPRVGDIDGDGVPDALVADAGVVSWARGRGDGAFDAPVQVFTGPVTAWDLADADGDGRADAFIAVAAPTGSDVHVLRGGASFTPVASVHVVADVNALAAGDVDGDGRADVVVAEGPSAQLMLADTGGRLVPSGVSPTPTNEPRVYDVDGDGRSDVVWREDGVAVRTGRAVRVPAP